MTKIVNPFEILASSETKTNADKQLTSESMDYHSTDECPKCKNPMQQGAIISNGEEVNYCVKCRVSSPLKV